jgi:acyl carrier protein
MCNAVIAIEPSQPPGDAPCPHCGTLLWFIRTSTGMRVYDPAVVAPIWEKIEAIMVELGVEKNATPFEQEASIDSLNMIELVMALETEFRTSIPPAEAENIKTVGDAIDHIHRNMKK